MLNGENFTDVSISSHHKSSKIIRTNVHQNAFYDWDIPRTVRIATLIVIDSHRNPFVQEVPSTGLDKWYQLEARSQRSNIQGSIRLKLWLSTREDHGPACTQNHFDNWTDVRRQERLLTIFADYEMSLTKSVSQFFFEIFLVFIFFFMWGKTNFM